jgi:hypothetical protein
MNQVIREVTGNDDELQLNTMKTKTLNRETTATFQGIRLFNVVQDARKNQHPNKQEHHHRLDRNHIGTKLGKYLFDLAQAWDAMDYEADERLVRHSLWGERGRIDRRRRVQEQAALEGKEVTHGEIRDQLDPPLHIRRTLDQSYFFTLKDTTHRDKDQVVYRQTKMRKEESYDGRSRKSRSRVEQKQDAMKDTGSGQKMHLRNRCAETNSRREASFTKLVGVARVVMVDQLWLWILDESESTSPQARVVL